MNVTEGVPTRRSIRAFLDTPVPLETLTRVMDKARWPALGRAQTSGQISGRGGNTESNSSYPPRNPIDGRARF